METVSDKVGMWVASDDGDSFFLEGPVRNKIKALQSAVEENICNEYNPVYVGKIYRVNPADDIDLDIYLDLDDIVWQINNSLIPDICRFHFEDGNNIDFDPTFIDELEEAIHSTINRVVTKRIAEGGIYDVLDPEKWSLEQIQDELGSTEKNNNELGAEYPYDSRHLTKIASGPKDPRFIR